MTVDEIYLKIGQEIFNVIESENWEKARLEIEVLGDGVVGYTGDYIEKNDVENIDVENIDDKDEWLIELHKITTEGGNNRWNRAVFSITSEGQFDMEFIWDQELNDEIERLSKS